MEAWKYLIGIGAASFAVSYLATAEIIACAFGWRFAATSIAAIRSVMSFLCTYIIVVDPNKLGLIVPYVIGDAFGTWLAMTKAKSEENDEAEGV